MMIQDESIRRRVAVLFDSPVYKRSILLEYM